MIGMKTASRIMKIRYVFHWMRAMRIGEIITIIKFQIQWAETEMAVPRARASRGKISGPYTQGTTLIVPPKISMYRKKNVTDADEVASRLKLRRTASIIMQMVRPAQPQIMVHRRPIRSRKKAGSKFPIGNMSWMKPAMSSAMSLLSPTLEVRAVGR